MYIQQEGNVFEQDDFNEYNQLNSVEHVKVVGSQFWYYTVV